jgi:AraC family L-rhamnose operon transcriptional activator RhaR
VATIDEERCDGQRNRPQRDDVSSGIASPTPPTTDPRAASRHAWPTELHEQRIPQVHGSTHMGPGSIVGIFPAHHFRAIPRHDHDCYELAIIESGQGLHVTTDRTVALRPGLAIFVPPGVAHEYRVNDEAHVYNCLFRAELIDAELLWARRDPLLGSLFDPDSHARDGDPAAVVMVPLDASAMGKAIAALEPIRTGEASTRAAQLAHLLLALDIVATANAANARGGEEPSATSSLVSVAIDLMTRDLAFPWTLDELSRRLFVGRFHLARTFTRAMGDPPMHYLARLRAERAAAMLGTTDLPVAAIGLKVGWADPAHFSRRFRAAFGLSPRTYRQHRLPGAGAGGPAARKDVQEQGNTRQLGG